MCDDVVVKLQKLVGSRLVQRCSACLLLSHWARVRFQDAATDSATHAYPLERNHPHALVLYTTPTPSAPEVSDIGRHKEGPCIAMAGSAMGHWRTSYWPKCRTCLGTILVISSIGPLSVVHSELILQETLHPRLISEDNAYKKDPTEPSLLPNDSRASRTPRSFPPSSSVRSSSTALSIANLSSASLRNMADYDKDLSAKEHTTPHHGSGSDYVDEEVGVVHKSAALNRDLKSRHMQMIAIGTLSSILPIFFRVKTNQNPFRWCYRCRSLRLLWKCSSQRWSSVARHLLHDYRYHASVHMPGTGRDGCAIPRQRRILHLCCPLY